MTKFLITIATHLNHICINCAIYIYVWRYSNNSIYGSLKMNIYLSICQFNKDFSRQFLSIFEKTILFHPASKFYFLKPPNDLDLFKCVISFLKSNYKFYSPCFRKLRLKTWINIETYYSRVIFSNQNFKTIAWFEFKN